MGKLRVNPLGVQPVVPATIPILREDLEKAVMGGLGNFASDVGMTVIKELLKSEVAERCGIRYSHAEDQEYRHGSQQGWAFVGGQKRPLKRPRVRAKKGAEVKLEAYKRFQDPEAMREAVLRRMMVHVSTRNYPRAIEEAADAAGIEKSSISRHFKTASAGQLKKLAERRLDGRRFPVIFIDGKDYDGDMLLCAMGVEELKDRGKDGQKVVLGIRQGSTENTATVTALLENLRSRGLDLAQPVLFVIDGSKALAAGIRRVCGWKALIQRCRIHKQRNVLAHVPLEYQAKFRSRFHEAFDLPHEKAKAELKAIARWLEGINPDAAGSLEEGMVELVTVNRLSVSPLLAKTLVTTNPLESMFSVGEEATRRVKRWRHGNMRLRWFASAMLDAERRINRIKGCLFLAQFVESLEKEVAKTSERELQAVA